MSDLQCPATFAVLSCAATPATGRVATRVAAVYAVPEGRGLAREVVQEPTLPVRPLEPDGTSYVSLLDDLADLHRGETVLVVLPHDAFASLAAQGRLPGAEADDVLRVAVDGDGWSVRLWTSSADRAPET